LQVGDECPDFFIIRLVCDQGGNTRQIGRVFVAELCELPACPPLVFTGMEQRVFFA
jgi:hypothetical protein